MMRWFSLLLLAALPVTAHVGSPDVFHEGTAGPYRLAVTIRPPTVIPGVAQVEVRALDEGVSKVMVTPLPLTGIASKLPPVADEAKQSGTDPRFYTGAVWLMKTGAWQVRVRADGSKGSGTLSVPLPAIANRTGAMQTGLGTILAGLALLLCVGLVGIVGASVREAQLPPGETPGPEERSRGLRFTGIAVLAVLGILYAGNNWWSAEANSYSRIIYKPLEMSANVTPDGQLALKLRDPGWIPTRKVDDLLPDHDHLMHLYVLKLPDLDRVWHLHPQMVASGEFRQQLPELPAGQYRLYGDIVHQTGFPETVVADLKTEAVAGRPLTGDDAAGQGRKLGEAKDAVAILPDGYRMVWDRDPGPLRAGQLVSFRFRLEDPQGQPAKDMSLYMGMQGHAAFIRSDLSTFAHIHPSGSVPMASLQLAQPDNDPHAMHRMMANGLPPVVSFPYGLPRPGAYRIIVQMKHGETVETGIFDTVAE